MGFGVWRLAFRVRGHSSIRILRVTILFEGSTNFDKIYRLEACATLLVRLLEWRRRPHLQSSAGVPACRFSEIQLPLRRIALQAGSLRYFGLAYGYFLAREPEFACDWQVVRELCHAFL